MILVFLLILKGIEFGFEVMMCVKLLGKPFLRMLRLDQTVKWNTTQGIVKGFYYFEELLSFRSMQMRCRLADCFLELILSFGIRTRG